MKRKDGQKKIKALRTKPIYATGLRETQNSLGMDMPPVSENAHSVVSLFSGCGGLDLGFQGGFRVFGKEYAQHPFKILSAYDNLSDAIETYRLNIGSEIEDRDLSLPTESGMPKADILLGGFPCQDFSSSGPKVGLEGERGKLYTTLVRYMKEHQPKIVVGENVPHLSRLAGGKYLDHILEEFTNCGYRFNVWELYCPEYGLPQSRRRLFIVGVRDDLPGFPQKPKPTHPSRYFTIDDALADLEKIDDESVTNQSQYFVASRATAGGGQGDHCNSAGEVAYCIRANSRGRIQFHYKLDRRLTVRECARLQSFPDDFVFPFTTQRNMTLIGNAVPPIVAHSVAASISAYLSSLESSDTKCSAIDGDFKKIYKQLDMAI